MKIAKIKRPKSKGKQLGYRIVIYQLRHCKDIPMGSIDEIIKNEIVKLFEVFVSASKKEGKQELAKVLIEMSELGVS